MVAAPKITREQLLRMIDELEKHPNDRVRILGDLGITLTGVGFGVAAAATVAGAVGATSVFGITTAASWIGWTVVAATPIGWTVGVAALAGVVAFSVSRLIRGGGLAEGRKSELLQRYREESGRILAKETAGSIVDGDRTRFILSLRELIDKNVLRPDKAFRLIEQVEAGRISLSHACALIQDLLHEKRITLGT